MPSATRSMRAARITQARRLTLEEVPLPEVGPREVRFRVEGCGVCASNLGPWLGLPWTSYPLAPGESGHEAWGVVDQVGAEVAAVKPNDRIAAISFHAYAEYDVAAEDAVFRLPPELDGVPFPGEPLACAMNIFARSGIRSGHTVAIIGVGFLGALLTRLAAAAGARVLAISRRASSLELATTMGADQVIPMHDHGAIIQEVQRLTEGQLCDRVIEAVGQQWPLDLAAELTKIRGTLVVAGYHQDGPRQVNMQLWNWRGLDVINAHERDVQIYTRGMGAALEAMREGRLDPTLLYSHRYPLERLEEALNAVAERPAGFIKALVLP